MLQYPKSFLVLDNSDIDAMLQIIYEERGLSLRDMTFSAARDMIEIRKLFKEPEYYRDMITMSLDTLKEKYDQATSAPDIIFYGYLYQEKKCFGLDYNDLIKFSLYIFCQDPAIRLKWQQRLEYIIIHDRRVPGHRRPAARAHGGAGRLPQEPVRGGRPRPDDLYLAWSQCEVSAGFR